MKAQVTINYSTSEITLRGKEETMKDNLAKFVNETIVREYLRGERFDVVNVRLFEGSKTIERFQYRPTIR